MFKIENKGSNPLAEVIFNQSIVHNDSMRISLVEDNTSYNNGFVYTTDLTDNASIVKIYRYNRLYIIIESYCEKIEDNWNNADEAVRSIAKVLSELDK